MIASENNITTLRYFQDIFQRQNELNTQIFKTEDWKNLDTPFYRALWVECAELAESLGFAWWSDSGVDKINVKLEIIDILHFLVSDLIKSDYTAEDVYEMWEEKKTIRVTTPIKDPLVLVDNLVMASLSRNHRDCLHNFFSLCYWFSLSSANLHQIYMGKNILNSFRNSNGYAEGKYIKNWNGLEDNYVMMSILQTTPKSLYAEMKPILWEKLEQKYLLLAAC